MFSLPPSPLTASTQHIKATFRRVVFSCVGFLLAVCFGDLCVNIKSYIIHISYSFVYTTSILYSIIAATMRACASRPLIPVCTTHIATSTQHNSQKHNASLFAHTHRNRDTTRHETQANGRGHTNKCERAPLLCPLQASQTSATVTPLLFCVRCVCVCCMCCLHVRRTAARWRARSVVRCVRMMLMMMMICCGSLFARLRSLSLSEIVIYENTAWISS